MLSLSMVDFVITLLKDVLFNVFLARFTSVEPKKYLDFVSCGRMTAYEIKFISSFFTYVFFSYVSSNTRFWKMGSKKKLAAPSLEKNFVYFLLK